jgi:hypothetical protein
MKILLMRYLLVIINKRTIKAHTLKALFLVFVGGCEKEQWIQENYMRAIVYIQIVLGPQKLKE